MTGMSPPEITTPATGDSTGELDFMAGELADVAAGIVPTADPLAISPEVKGSIRILIVEDDRTLREGLLITLRAEGYNVAAVTSGEEALESIKRSRYDIILTDLHLPRVTGLDVVRGAL